MIIYGDERRRENTKRIIDQLRAAAKYTDETGESHLRDLLIMAGELEQGITDALGASIAPGLESGLRVLCAILGTALFAARQDDGDKVREQLGLTINTLSLIETHDPPADIIVSTPEGYAYYALYPDQYQAAAEQWLDEAAAEDRAKDIVLIGVRSTGTSLAGAVAGALRARGCRVESFTVRPTGHPFERVIGFNPVQQQIIAASSGGYFLAVDEGPGMSGSSLAAVGAALLAAGVPANRIVFMPGHGNGPGSAASDEVRHVWDMVQARPALPHDLFALPALSHLSRGAAVETPDGLGPDYSPFARISFVLLGDRQRLLSYAGLGSSGYRALSWAQRLVAAGLLAGNVALADGFLLSVLHDGPTPEATGSMTDQLAKLIDLAAEEAPQPCPPVEKWLEMIYWNTWEALGDAAAEQTKVLADDRWRVALPANNPSAICVGQNPHDWYMAEGEMLLRRPLGGINGHTFTNAGSTAWHLAQFEAEWEASDEWVRSIAANLRRATVPNEHELLCGRLAYAAYGVGLAKTCGMQSATPDYWWRRYDRHKTALAERLKLLSRQVGDSE